MQVSKILFNIFRDLHAILSIQQNKILCLSYFIKKIILFNITYVECILYYHINTSNSKYFTSTAAVKIHTLYFLSYPGHQQNIFQVPTLPQSCHQKDKVFYLHEGWP